MKVLCKKSAAVIFAVLVLLGVLAAVVPQLPSFEAKAAGIDNITARADYLYNITWVAQKDVNGWKNRESNKFYAGNTYRIPYGQPVTQGKYICYGASIDTFLSAAADPTSIFYTTQSYYGSGYSTYYAMDCSAFVSYCWGLASRKTTYDISVMSSVTKIGPCTSANISKIQQGDALNRTGDDAHVVIVSRISGNNYEITEQTPPQIKRSWYTADELVSKYSSYTICRYNNRDSVAPPPVSKPEAPKVSIDKQLLKVGEQATVRWSGSETATYFWISCWSDTEQCISTEGFNGSHQVSFTEPGKYGLTVVAGNGSGETLSEWIEITVYNSAPEAPRVSIDKQLLKVGEQTTVRWSGSETATYFWISCWSDTEQCISTEGFNGSHQVSFTEPGKYGLTVVAGNGCGETLSEWIEITVYNSAPEASRVSIDKQLLKVGEQTTVRWSGSETATYFWISCWSDTEQCISTEGFNGSHQVSFTEPGKYGLTVVAGNGCGETLSEWIEITVYNSAPEAPKVSIDKRFLKVGEQATVTWSGSETATYFWVSCWSDTEQCISTEGFNESHNVSFNKPGKYWLLIVAGNGCGETLSDWVGITVSAAEINYSLTPAIKGAASKLYEPWGLKYFASYDGDDVDRIAERGVVMLKDEFYTADMTPEAFRANENAYDFSSARDELGFEAPSAKYPNGRYTALLDEGIYSYDISAAYYALPYAVMENGQIVYGAIRNISMEQVLNSNLSSSAVSAEEKTICTCILALKESVATYYSATGIQGASVDIHAPRGSSQIAAAKVMTPAESGITPAVKGAASRLIEPWGLKFTAAYTDDSRIADRGIVMLREDSYSDTYASNQDAMRLNAEAYVFTEGDETLQYVASSDRYSALLTEGISSRDISAAYYAAPFVVLNDGTYVYGTVRSISMLNILNTNLSSSAVSAEEKAVCQDIIDLYNAVKAFYEAA